jgi:hypothetical protein
MTEGFRVARQHGIDDRSIRAVMAWSSRRRWWKDRRTPYRG